MFKYKLISLLTISLFMTSCGVNQDKIIDQLKKDSAKKDQDSGDAVVVEQSSEETRKEIVSIIEENAINFEDILKNKGHFEVLYTSNEKNTFIGIRSLQAPYRVIDELSKNIKVKVYAYLTEDKKWALVWDEASFRDGQPLIGLVRSEHLKKEQEQVEKDESKDVKDENEGSDKDSDKEGKEETVVIDKPKKPVKSKTNVFPFRKVPTHNFLRYDRVFGARRSKGKRKHAAFDLKAPKGRKIYATEAGKIIRFAPFYMGTHALVVLGKSGKVIRYGETMGRLVKGLKVGSRVKKDQHIGYVGRLNSGNSMLHFELYKGTKKGRLSQKRGKYRRRSDLMNPKKMLLSLYEQRFGEPYPFLKK